MLLTINPPKTTELSIKDKVLEVIQWTELEYAEFQELQGYMYLKNEFGSNTPFIDLLPYQPLFWKWWINHWLRRDVVFLNTHKKYNLPLHIKRAGYKANHSPEMMYFKPQSAILRQSYTLMIGKLIKAAQNER